MPTRVLVIEDDTEQLEAIMKVLSSHGYQLDAVSDAAMAMTTVRNATPDVIVLDLGLPGGGGVEVLRRLRKLPSTMSLPVVVYTARTELTDLALQAGAQRVIAKGGSFDALITAIEDLRSNPRDEAEFMDPSIEIAMNALRELVV